MSSSDQLFDHYAGNYETVLGGALSATGEDVSFYAWNRIAWLARVLSAMNYRPRTVLDFGCGVGGATEHLLKAFDLTRLVGVDVSADSIQSARERWHEERVTFSEIKSLAPEGRFDLVFCNGVFHHIPLEQRASAMRYILQSLRPGGIFALWENNPWNPGTRLVMRRCEFDRDAITLTPPTARKMAEHAGLEVLRTDFLFIFPRMLKALRWVEPRVARWPIGGQYQVLSRKPGWPPNPDCSN